MALGNAEDTSADIVVRAGARASADGRIVTVCAPRWQPPAGVEHLLADAYRDAVAAANLRQARTMVLVGELDRLSREDSLTGVANRRAWDEASRRPSRRCYPDRC